MPATATLLERYGAAYPMTELRRVLAGDCPRLLPSASINERCDAHFPELPQITGKGNPAEDAPNLTRQVLDATRRGPRGCVR
jgi:hypothetical protein